MTDFKTVSLQIKVTKSEAIRLKSQSEKENRSFSDWGRITLLGYTDEIDKNEAINFKDQAEQNKGKKNFFKLG